VIHINNANLIAGSKTLIDKPLKTYSVEITNFLNDLSNVIFQSEEIRLYPDISAFAFWCRYANIQKIKKNYNDLNKRLGRGLCFHIAPSNIPLNFAFSYVFSLLSGNANIVRIPSKFFPQVEYLCQEIDKVLQSYSEILKRTAFIQYSKEDEDLSIYFSSIADCRMIWGGDSTIKKFKYFETKPNCIDINFSDKYSICIIDGQSVLKTNDQEMIKLANNFYNDTYLMDQNACSSPQLIYWINDSKNAREKFWKAIYKFATLKYELQDSVVMDKYSKLCIDLIDMDSIESVSNITNMLYNIELSELDLNTIHLRGKCGYFYEYSLSTYDDLFSIITEKYQTITYYGIDAIALELGLIKSCVKGVFRIVPIGEALNIDLQWDGHDMLIKLSRKIVVK